MLVVMMRSNELKISRFVPLKLILSDSNPAGTNSVGLQASSSDSDDDVPVAKHKSSGMAEQKVCTLSGSLQYTGGNCVA